MKRTLFILLAAVALGGLVYLATLGCLQLIGSKGREVSLLDRLGLSASERAQASVFEKDFLIQKNESCALLCAKRAQLIELLKQSEPDRSAMAQLAEEIGQEQTALEKATLHYIVSVGAMLGPSRKTRLTALVAEEMRTACRQTACGLTEGCFVSGTGKK